MATTFQDLNLSQPILSAIEKLGFTHPTSIQEKAIPALLNTNTDFHGQAETGTGKTLAFGIPLLESVDASDRSTQALIVAPTRELVMQITQSLKEVSREAKISVEPIYGGVSIDNQIRNLRRGVHIAVGTPGRLNDLLNRGKLKIDGISTLVLDEADIMLDMGFREDIDIILKYAPKTRNIWLFSATVKEGINRLSRKHMSNPVVIKTNDESVTKTNINQQFAIIPMRDRATALCRFIDNAPGFFGFIFCQRKMQAAELADVLIRHGYVVAALHGDMSQAQRNRVIKKFKNKEFKILVCTDVAARGIDVQEATHVINYTIPEDQEGYIHRIGRTGRAGRTGTAITFISRHEFSRIKSIQRKFKVEINPIDVPGIEQIIQNSVISAKKFVDKAADWPITHYKHAQQLEEALKDADESELRKIVIALLHERFFKQVIELEKTSFSPTSQSMTGMNGNVEISINVGSDDDLGRDDVMAFITDPGIIQADEVLKLRVIKRRSFIEIPEKKAGDLIEQLDGKQLGGRRVRAEVVNEEQQARRRSSNSRGGGRSSGGGSRSRSSSRPQRKSW